MAKLIVEFTDVEDGKAISMETRVESKDGETESWSVLFGLAVKHLWATGELQKFADQNKEQLVAKAVKDAEAYHAKQKQIAIDKEAYDAGADGD